MFCLMVAADPARKRRVPGESAGARARAAGKAERPREAEGDLRDHLEVHPSGPEGTPRASEDDRQRFFFFEFFE